ncbi:hypothetical protein ACF3NR_06875 [Vaginella massiliensis]|uniref:hypothetical protein n=1 Tax=Vaginella massiliensis TaxID=1816680 RepID=UPI00375117FA
MVFAGAFLANAQVGVNTETPTEKFDVSGTVRVQSLPNNGSTNSINTLADGTAGTNNFVATRTVVADQNGVFGTVNYVPKESSNVSQNACYASTSQNFSEVNNQGVAQIDFEDFSFSYHVNTAGSSGNYLQIRNNKTTTVQGYTSSMGGNGSSKGYVPLPPNTWVHMTGNLNWDVEYAGEFLFFTDQNVTGTQLTDMDFFRISYYGQKRTSSSYPNVCLSVTKYR